MYMMKRFIICLVCLFFLGQGMGHASADAQIVTVTGSYTMGEAETLSIAKERALQDAKRLAAEQVGVYVQSSTVTESHVVTQDTVITMAAAFLRLAGSPAYQTVALPPPALGIIVQATITAEVDDSDLQRLREGLADRSKVAAYKQINDNYQRLQREIAMLQAKLPQARTTAERTEITQAIHRNEAAYQSYLLLQQACENPEQSGELLDRALVEYDANAAAYAARADLRLGNGDFAGGEEDCRSGLLALSKSEDYTSEQKQMLAFILHCLQGNASFMVGKQDDAMQAYDEAERLAIGIDAEAVQADIYNHFLFNRASLYLIDENYAEADVRYTQLIDVLERTSSMGILPAIQTQPAEQLDYRHYMLANVYTYRAIARYALGNSNCTADFRHARELAAGLPSNEKTALLAILQDYPY